MRTCLVPMAGRGTRFLEAGYEVPKPFLPVVGVPMIRRVVDNLPSADRWVFVAQADHLDRYGDLMPDGEIVAVNGPTSGGAASCLAAADLLDGELLVANADQLIVWADTDFGGADVVVPTFRASGSKWAYLTDDGRTTATDTHRAQCGVYWWRRASDFVAAVSHLEGDTRIGFASNFHDGPVLDWPVVGMYGLGTPADYEAFNARPSLSV